MAIDIQKDAAERFASDTATHVMTVLHDDGLYRHLRFSAPDHGFSWFELITWPGALAIRGDHGGHVFSRTDDMFQFFRSRTGSINPGYWAEKTPDRGVALKQYSEEKVRALLEPLPGEYAEVFPHLLADYRKAAPAFDALPLKERLAKRRPVNPTSPDVVRQMIADYDDIGDLNNEDGARRLLRELESANVVSDTWEWDLSNWDYHYLWCCHAIVWGIAQYDASRTAPAVAMAATP